LTPRTSAAPTRQGLVAAQVTLNVRKINEEYYSTNPQPCCTFDFSGCASVQSTTSRFHQLPEKGTARLLPFCLLNRKRVD